MGHGQKNEGIDMSKREVKRKDFSEWQVTIVYMFQEGVCYNARKGCYNPLTMGLRRHHIDGNPENNSLDNLALICRECHHATYRGAKRKRLQAHEAHEKKIFEDLNKLIEAMLPVGDRPGRISGITSKQLIEAMSMSLKVSRRVNHIDEDLEYPPPTITIFKRLLEEDMLKDAYLEGFKTAMGAISLPVQTIFKPEEKRNVSET